MTVTPRDLNAALTAIFVDLSAERDAAAERAIARLNDLSRTAADAGLPLIVDEHITTLKAMVGLTTDVEDDEPGIFSLADEIATEEALAEEESSEDDYSDDDDTTAEDEWSDGWDVEDDAA